MIIVKVEKTNIEKALKAYKWKYKRTKVKEQLTERKEFKKKSVKRREEKNKAKYKNKKNGEN